MRKLARNILRITYYVLRITFLPFLFFLAWAIVFSYPLVLHLGDSVVLAKGGDAWQHLWNLWWADKSLVDLHRSPYHTSYLFYPTGTSLYYHSLDLFNGVISIPLQRLLGLTLTFNLLTIATLTLDGLAAYWLCLDRTKSQGAALVGGALFASAPLLGASLDRGQLDEITVWWIPLYILALWRVLDSPGPVWARGDGRRAVLAAGVCLVGASLAIWYFTVGLAIFTALFVPAYLAARSKFLVPSSKSDRSGVEPGTRNQELGTWLYAATKLTAIVVVFLLTLSPLFVAMARESQEGVATAPAPLSTVVFNSADLAGFFLPPRLDAPDINRHGSSVALGYVALALGLAGLLSQWRKLWPVGLGLVGLLVMSLGPELQLLGNRTGIPMPYALLADLPFLAASRSPLRFDTTAFACLALLGAFGVAWLLARSRVWQKAVVPVALALLVLEQFGVPRLTVPTALDPAYSFVKNASAEGAVLEVPASNWTAQAMWHQTLHERPIVGGYTSRHVPYPFGDMVPGVAQLMHEDPGPLLDQDILTPPVSATALASLDYYGVRFVVAHKDDLATGRYSRLASVLGALYTDKNKVYEDVTVAVYQTPHRTGSALPLLALASGWHTVERNPIHRWTGANGDNGDASIWIGIPQSAVSRYTLNLTAYAYKSPRHLSIVLDGHTLSTRELGTAFTYIQMDLGRLATGEHNLLLHVQEPPESPPGDERKLDIGVTRVEVARGSRQ